MANGFVNVDSAEKLEEDVLVTGEENEWSKLLKARFKEGYVEGRYMGGESTVQSGFDHGYQKGFEISYPISIVKGLLAANEILLKETKPESLQRSKEVRHLLDEFETKYKQFDLQVNKSNETNENELDIPSNVLFGNRDSEYVENRNEDSLKIVNVSNNEISEMKEELNILKKKVLMFLKDCNQPLIFNQIDSYFEKWDLHLHLRQIPCDTSHSTSDILTALPSTQKQN